MYFRPFPVLTVVAIPALIALVWLGVWQSQRAGWKASLITSFEAAAQVEPQPVEAALCQGKPEEGAVVAPPQASGKTVRVFGHNAAGAAGWRVFQATNLSCGAVLAQSGFEALAINSAPPVKQVVAAPTRYIVEPWPEKSLMAAENAPSRNEWHWFDAPLMAASLDAAPLNAAFILTPLEGTPEFLIRTPPETHVGYAVTWFGMAIAFLVIYGVFHARAGRLRFGKGKAAE